MTKLDEERSLDELSLLTDTAGSEPVDQELVKRERIDPAELVERARNASAALFTHTDLRLATVVDPDLPMVIGDPNRLLQVLLK